MPLLSSPTVIYTTPDKAYRIVWVHPSGREENYVIEHLKGKDSLGAERWELIETIYTRDHTTHFNIHREGMTYLPTVLIVQLFHHLSNQVSLAKAVDQLKTGETYTAHPSDLREKGID
jgi:hypothetical protein